MKTFARLMAALAVGTVLAESQTPGQIDEGIKTALIEFVKVHYQSPEDYVISRFKDHDVIFLGEWHRIKHDPELVQRLIPLLDSAGIHYLGYEFARRIEQPLIDSLLQAPTYDEKLARSILFKNFAFWGYQEYVDIFKAAWQCNRSSPNRKQPFRVLGLGNSPNWSIIKSQGDLENREVVAKVWHGETEADWAKPLFDSVISKGEKALVYCGIHHAFTEYRQPVVIGGKFIRFGDIRVGNCVYQKVGKRAMTIYLHAPWVSAEGYDTSPVRAADGYIDAVLNKLGPKFERVGFDLRGTPFGRLPGETSIYKFGYQHFTLDTIYDGYVCQGPLSAYKGVTPIGDFITKENLDEARAQSPNPRLRELSAEDINKGIAEDADIPRRLAGLK